MDESEDTEEEVLDLTSCVYTVKQVESRNKASFHDFKIAINVSDASTGRVVDLTCNDDYGGGEVISDNYNSVGQPETVASPVNDVLTHKRKKREKKKSALKEKEQVLTAKEVAAYCSIAIDPRFVHVQEVRDAIDAQVTNAMRKCRSEAFPNFLEERYMFRKDVIGFLRPTLTSLAAESSVPLREMDKEMLIVLDVVEYIKLAYNSVHSEVMDFDDIGTLDLKKLIADLENSRSSEVSVTVFVLNLSNYYNECLRYSRAVARCENGSQGVPLTKGRYPILSACKVILSERQLSKATLVLGLEKNVSIFAVDNVDELAQHILSIFRAVAEKEQRMFMQAKLGTFTFLPEGEAVSSVRVDRASGAGYKKLWCEALQQCFGRSFPEGANAIVRKYGCPQALLKAYGQLETEEEKELLLANLSVETRLGFQRRLGEAYSRKVYISLTCHDPDRIVN